MSNFSTILAVVLPVLCLVLAVFVGIKTMNKTCNARRAFSKHLITLLVALMLCFGCVSFASAASADAETTEATTATSQTAVTENKSGAGLAAGLGFIGAGLSIGLAAVGAGLALASGAPAAIGAVAEDPKSFGKSMIFVALGEAVAIYGFIIAFLIILRLPNGITL